MLFFFAFIGSRLGILFTNDDFLYKDSRKSLTGDLSINTLAYNSDKDILVDNILNLKARNIRLKIICYKDINLFYYEILIIRIGIF
jgi:hypothetical protein